MKELTSVDLSRITGGNTGPQVCTPADPRGLKRTQYWENSPPTSAPGRMAR